MNSNLDYSIHKSEDCITFKNENTTLGFIRFCKEGEIEYIFVNPLFRKKGIAKKLISLAEEKVGKKLIPQEPISPLGQKLFNHAKS